MTDARSTPDVSVILVSYNTKALTLRCLAALHATQTDAVSCEMVVVDNASTDGSADAIAESFPDVRLIRLDENVGWGRGVNRGAVGSHADFLLLLNPDTETVGTAVSDLVLFARENPGHGLYTGRTLDRSGVDDHFSCWGLPTLWSLFCYAAGLSVVFRRQRWANPEALPRYDRQSVREVPAISGCMMLVDRRLFLRLGGFDPAYFMYSEDIDLCARARGLGARPVVFPGAAVIHVGGASSSSEGQRVKILRGKVTYMRQRWSPAKAQFGSILLLAGVGVRALAKTTLRVRGRGPADWAAIWRERATWSAGWPPVDEPRPIAVGSR